MNRKAIQDFPAYSVDDQGNIYREGRETPLAKNLTKKGYMTVNLSMNGKSHRRTVHRIVLESFSGLRPDGFHGCHLDGDKTNNSVKNLVWATPKDNESHKAKHGTMAIGIRNGQHKLTNEQVQIIRSRKASGKKEWGAKALAHEFGVNISTVVRVSIGHQWKHLRGIHEER